MPLFQWAEMWVGSSGTKMASYTQFHKRKRHDVRTCDVDGLQYSRSSLQAISTTHRWGTTCYSDVRASPDGSEKPHHLIIDEYMKVYCQLHVSPFVRIRFCVTRPLCEYVCVCVCVWLPFFSLLPYLHLSYNSPFHTHSTPIWYRD